MKKSDLFKQERKAKLDEAQRLLDTVKAESRDMKPEEQTRFDALTGEVEALDAKIESAERQEKFEERLARDKAKNDGLESEQREISKDYSLLRHLRSAVDNRPVDGFEREMEQEAEKEFTQSGVTMNRSGSGLLIPMKVLQSRSFGTPQKRDMTVLGGDPAGVEGGYTVATEVQGYIPALRERALLTRLGVGFMDGLVGNIQMPRENAVATFAWEGETDETAETSPTFTKVDLKPERLAGFVDVSQQLLRQSSVGIQQRVEDQILLGHALALDLAGFAGTGNNDQPTGIINDSDVIVFAVGTNGGAITDAGILEMEQLLSDNFGAMGPVFITTTKGRRKLKNTALDAGSGIFLWDRRDNTVEGYNAFATSHLPSNLTKGSGSALSAAILGTVNAQTATFGMWGGLEILVNPYTKAKSGLVEMIINSYCDFAVTQPKAFVVCKDFNTTIS